MPEPELEIFSTCPQSSAVPRERYCTEVAEIARWSEEFGCKGILVYTDNSLVDAWLTSMFIMQNTKQLCPLVAVQPVYMHPYTVAKMVSSFAYMFGRRIYLNLVAGGFKNDLLALNDSAPHDKRYERLNEYTTIIKRLLSSTAPVTYDGEFYRVDNLRMSPPLPPELFPGIIVSGSSEAGLAAAQALAAVAIRYPEPAEKYMAGPLPELVGAGIRVGVIARPSRDEAWQVANARFPADRKGELTHQLAIKTSDSVWHHQLAAHQSVPSASESTYWLRPFETYKSFCPYLVGSYEAVGNELARYIALGFRTFILDIPAAREELYHINGAFAQARRKSVAPIAA